jgi:serine/threonine-protein kinase
MIEDRPRHRYQSAQEVFVDLQKLRPNPEITSQSKVLATETLSEFRSASSPNYSRVNPQTRSISSTSIPPEEETIIVPSSVSPSHSLKTSSQNSQLSPSIEETQFLSKISTQKEQKQAKSSHVSQPVEETMIVNTTNSGTNKPSSPKQQPRQQQPLSQFPSQAAKKTSQTSLNSQFIQRCQQELAYCIGPMASLIVEEIMFQYTPQSPQELVNALAEQIPDPQKAMQFKQRLFS